MQKYSVFNLIKNAFSSHENWEVAWKDPTPKKSYDVIIIGGGGHGLATAYYLAKEHNITNVAIIEKGWIGGGNVGRNTTIIRSNFMHDANGRFNEFSMDLWRNMSQELNFNVMFSPRGIINLAHSDAQMNAYARRGNSMRLNGIDAVLLNREQVKKLIPMADFSEDVRFPIFGGLMQPSAGTARHDAVAWGYARQADSMGVDIIQNCEVKKIKTKNGKVYSVETSRGNIRAKRVGVVASGHTSILAETAGIKLPLQSKPLQALVSEPIKPIINTVVMSNAVHAYISQSDKGELVIGAGTDGYNSFTQRGGYEIIEDTIRAIIELYPVCGKMKMLRQWGGIVDICPDASPIISKCDVEGLFFNCGWGTGGFKATPGSANVFAHTIAKNEAHQINSAFNLDRFASGKLVDEHGAAAVAH